MENVILLNERIKKKLKCFAPFNTYDFIALKEKIEHFGIQMMIKKREKKINSFRSINLIFIFVFHHLNAADFILGARSIEIHCNGQQLKMEC